MGIVFKGGSIVNSDSIEWQDLRVDGPVIDGIGVNLALAGDEIIDVTGCYLFPGGIDPHTHFDLDTGSTVTADDFASGSKAALAGGTTTVIDYATQVRGDSLAAALSIWHRKARGKSFTDYGFHMAMIDCRGSILRELAELPLRQGVSSVKLYMAYKDVLQVDDADLLKVMRICRKSGLRVCLHCENGDIIQELIDEAKEAGENSPRQHALTRPEAVEAEAVYRAICLAEVTGCSLYVVHVSSGRAKDIIKEAQRRGLPVTAETCPQYLLLDESCYEQADFTAAKYVMSPPLRSLNNQEMLWQGVKDGTIACIGSDHCSFNWAKQKTLGRHDFSLIPNGIPGAENRFGLLYTFGVASGRLSLQEFVSATSCNAAKLFGLYPRKGWLGRGSDADIVVWDPTRRSVVRAATQLQNVDYNPYEGFEQIGAARHVFLRGLHLVSNGVVQKEPVGKYLPRNPLSNGEVI
jgi:dihydropyrimidinase